MNDPSSVFEGELHYCWVAHPESSKDVVTRLRTPTLLQIPGIFKIPGIRDASQVVSFFRRR